MAVFNSYNDLGIHFSFTSFSSNLASDCRDAYHIRIAPLSFHSNLTSSAPKMTAVCGNRHSGAEDEKNYKEP